MRLEYSQETDQAYVHLKDKVAKGESVVQVVIDDDALNGDIVIDVDADGRILGFEFPNRATTMLPDELFDEFR